MMDRQEITSLLADFLNNDMNIDIFTEKLTDILFMMRQNDIPDETRSLLSKVQLYLHEYDENIRDIHEVYIVTQSVLDVINPTKKVYLSKFSQLIIPPTKPGTVSSETDSPAPVLSKVKETVLN
jgi:hypothetical protein